MITLARTANPLPALRAFALGLVFLTLQFAWLTLLAGCGGDAEEGVASSTALVMGTHTVGLPIEESFVVSQPDGELPVVLGGQGANMVVCAVRTRRVLDVEQAYVVDVELVYAGGTSHPRLRRSPVLGTDGYYYFPDLYQLLSGGAGDTSWAGATAAITVEVRTNSTLPPIATGHVTGTLTDRRGPPTFGVNSPDTGEAPTETPTDTQDRAGD